MNTVSTTARQFNAAVISKSELFTLGIRQILRNQLGAASVCIFSAPEKLGMVHASGQESIDIVIIDDDALSRGKAPYHWLNSFEGLKQAGIIILSGSYSLAEVTEKLRKGAKACVGKHMPLELLHEAITSVLNGECWVEEDLRHHYSLPDKRRYGGVMIPEIVQFNILTAAEKTVIRKLLQGMTVTDIANKTCRSVKTISSQKQSAMRKLQVNSIVELYRTFSKVAAN